MTTASNQPSFKRLLAGRRLRYEDQFAIIQPGQRLRIAFTGG